MSVPNTENEFQIKSKKHRSRIIDRLPKSMRLYLIAFAVVFVVCCLTATFQIINSKSITITLNSASVSKGQNPDGSPFDIYQILSDDVLEAASEKMEGRISAAELKRHLSVSDALSAKTNRQLKQSILDGEHENNYFPTVYRVTYATVSEAIRAEGIVEQVGAFFKGFAFPKMDKILKTVAECYQEYYEVSYLNYDAMFEIDWEKIDAMDYYNRADALRTEAMRILRFLSDKSDENPTAVSSNNLSYRDLTNNLWKLISSDIENHQAYIIQNNITTARKTLQRQFRYMEEIHIEEKERKTEEYLILNEAVDMYDSTTTKVVFIPALDQDNSFYMNRTKVGLDYLVESADNARLAANDAEHNAQYYQYLQTCFANTTASKQSKITHTETIYQNIKDQIEEMMESTKLLLAESNKTNNEGIKVSNPGRSVGIVGVGMSFAKRFVILSMAAYVLLYVPTAVSKKKDTDSQEV